MWANAKRIGCMARCECGNELVISMQTSFAPGPNGHPDLSEACKHFMRTHRRKVTAMLFEVCTGQKPAPITEESFGGVEHGEPRRG